MDRFAQMILASARQAETDSGITIAGQEERVGASIATGIGGLKSFQDCYDVLKERGPDRVNPFSIPSIIPNMGAGWVSIELGTQGPLMSECTACAASNMAIGDAVGRDPARSSRRDVRGWHRGADHPCRHRRLRRDAGPFAAQRRSEGRLAALRCSAGWPRHGRGAAVLVLEELEQARERGAKIYGELLGYGVSSDAAHMTEPDPTGENPARAMKMALADGDIDPSEVGYVNAHATSTPLGDASETKVIKKALGEENAARSAVSSTKGATGHCFGAAGAVEAVFTVLAVERGILPPTINYEQQDPECDLDYIPNEARKADITVGVSNSFGFGGHNAVYRRCKLED